MTIQEVVRVDQCRFDWDLTVAVTTAEEAWDDVPDPSEQIGGSSYVTTNYVPGADLSSLPDYLQDAINGFWDETAVAAAYATWQAAISAWQADPENQTLIDARVNAEYQLRQVVGTVT